MFLNGDKVPRNLTLAEEYFKIGHDKGLWSVSLNSFDSRPIFRIKFECSPHLVILTFLGVVEVTWGLSCLYSKPERFDRTKMIDYCLVAANKGLAVAQHNAGVFYFQAMEENQPAAPLFQASGNPSLWTGIEYYKMAATQNFYQSQINLGKIYTRGYDTKNTE